MNVLKTILKFKLKWTLKQIQHVSVQSHHHRGVHYSCFAKVTVTSASMSNALPDDGVTAPKHVRTVLMSILM